MSGKKFKHAILGAAVAGAMAFGLAGTANAAIVQLDGWNLNLSLADGKAWTGGPAGFVCASCLSNATNIDYMNVNGTSIVLQNLSGGSPIGQTFTDTGTLQISTYRKEGFSSNSTVNINDYILYFQFKALTGTFNTIDSFTFDTPSDSISLILASVDAFGNPVSTLDLADFDIIAPSGGSAFQFFGGAGFNGHVDVTMVETAGIDPALWTDSGGNPLPPGTALHLLNLDALITSAVFSGPAGGVCDPVAGGPDCDLVTFNILNGGQYKLAIETQTVPEPGTLGLLGVGLALLGFGKRRRKVA